MIHHMSAHDRPENSNTLSRNHWANLEMTENHLPYKEDVLEMFAQEPKSVSEILRILIELPALY